jgi:predicted alpha/beta-hydrolase family hydrolase
VAKAVKVREIETPSGPARVHLSPGGSSGLLVLGHGAGGGIEAPDLVAVTFAMHGAGWTVARVEQPYRVKGHRAPEPAPKLDAAWIAVITAVMARRRGPLVVGGRSSGARVACRTASAVAASAVIALAFPLHPPGKPEKSRVDELMAVRVPTLVVQGERDVFGSPAQLPAGPTIVAVRGDHSLRQGPEVVAAAVVDWVLGIGL